MIQNVFLKFKQYYNSLFFVKKTCCLSFCFLLHNNKNHNVLVPQRGRVIFALATLLINRGMNTLSSTTFLFFGSYTLKFLIIFCFVFYIDHSHWLYIHDSMGSPCDNATSVDQWSPPCCRLPVGRSGLGWGEHFWGDPSKGSESCPSIVIGS